MIEYVNKNWGFERIFVNNEKYCAKNLHINSRFECSLHYHQLKDETFYIIAGEIELFLVDLSKFNNPRELVMAVELSDYATVLKHKDVILSQVKSIRLNRGEQFRLKPYMAHKFRAVTSGAVILEVSTTHFDEDSYRITQSRALTSKEYNVYSN